MPLIDEFYRLFREKETTQKKLEISFLYSKSVIMKSFIQLFGQFDPKLYRSMTPA